MAKFKESELNDILKDFKNKGTIELEFEKSLSGKIVLNEVIINYNRENGYINIESREGKFEINTTLVSGYEKIEDQIYIDLDTLSLRFKIKN